MYCPKCGTENPDNAQICSSCTSILTGDSTSGVVPGAQTSGLAITSLVLGILSFCALITAIPAIVFGIIALVKIAKTPGRLKGRGLAIAGIVVPSVWVLFVLPMLMAILMPALARARAMAQQALCGTNLRGVALAIQMYADDNDKQYPTPDKWCDLLEPYSGSNQRLFVCPSAEEGPCHYAINPNARPDSPPDMVLLFETRPGWNQSGGPEILTTENHYDRGSNILFVDMRVKFVKTEHLKDLRW